MNKRAILFRSSLFLALLLLSACTRSSLLLVNTMARFDDFTRYENISYGDATLNKLDVYRPKGQLKKSTEKSAVIVFFYGGCWGGCEVLPKEDYTFVAQALTAKGYLVVIPDYRHYPEVHFEQIIDDARLSVEWVKNNIEQYGGDPNALFIMGHSAGAHLGAMLVLNESYLQKETYKALRGFVGLAGAYDFLPFTDAYQNIVFGPEECYPQSQPVNFVSGTEPPLLLLYGNEDKTVFPRNIKSLTKEVLAQGGRVEAHTYDGIDHSSILASFSLFYQHSKPILSDITRFLDSNG